MNETLKAVLEDLKAEEYERTACCSGGRLPQGQGCSIPQGGSGGQGEDANDSEKPENYDLEGNSKHYATPGCECIDAIQAATAGRDGFEGYLVGQCIKYLWRYGRKSPAGRRLDLIKVKWYLHRLMCYIGAE